MEKNPVSLAVRPLPHTQTLNIFPCLHDFLQSKSNGSSVNGTRAVVAIEIGTHRSGWASSMQDKTEGDIIVRVPEGNSQGEKTDTAVILGSHSDKVLAFGSSARERYLEDEVGGRLFLNFMRDFPQSNATTECGLKVPLLRVMGAVLCHFKTAALAHLSSASETPVAVADVAWVISVPATFDRVARGLVLDAALRSGIIDKVNSPRLELCPEPNAAYLAVYQESPDLPREVGTKTMIVDCGASTVDITTFEVVSLHPLHLKKLIPTISKAWGSTCVDQAFEEWFKAFIGKENFSRVSKTSSFYDLMLRWEESKTKFEGKPNERFKFSMADISCELNFKAGNIQVSVVQLVSISSMLQMWP